MTLLAAAGSRLSMVFIAAAFLAGSTSIGPSGTDHAFTAVGASTAAPGAPIHRTPRNRRAMPKPPALPVPAALNATGLSLRSGPDAVPISLHIPSIGVNIAVIGVGVTPKNVMDAPEGPAADPVWQEAFWYRGSAVPGAASTALFAGHIDDPFGRPGSFARIGQLRRGDIIVVHDDRNGLNVRFAVTGSHSYSLGDATNAAVLTRMYGAGPVAGLVPQRSSDGLAHITLVTCAGTFQHSIGTHDHRLAVYATRIP